MGKNGKNYKEINPYRSKILLHLDNMMCFIMRIGSINHLLSCFIWTTKELKTPWKRGCLVIIFIPMYLCAFLMLLPITLASFFIWMTFQHKRDHFRIVKSLKHESKDMEENSKDIYSFGTTNICLLPEFLSRFNNSSDNMGRAKEFARRLFEQQTTISNDKNLNNCIKSHSSFTFSNGTIDHRILTDFPALDVLFVQETWLPACVDKILPDLSKVFPYIIYDARVNSWSANRYLSSSGLMIASRYPILQADFNWYQSKCFACKYASKGLLQVKLDLGVSKAGNQLVGYASTTHLQAYQGTLPIQNDQMNDIVQWTGEFREKSLCEGEIVMFDTVGGDFNNDNMSPVDEPNWNNKLFSIYQDVCRQRPGKDYHWTVGTEMRHRPLHDSLISTPEGLKAALEVPELLQYYVLDADAEELNLEIAQKMPDRDADGNQILTPVGGRRRIDYILYRKEDDLIPLACNPVTQMACLTDHIAYSLTVKVPNQRTE